MGRAITNLQICRIAGAVLFGTAACLAPAQEPAAPALQSPAQDSLPRCTQGTIPALTPVLLQIEEPLGSKISAIGQKFRFTLARSLVLDGCVAIPAGTPGEGEVVHASKASFMGAGGEFVAAARYLEFDGRRVPLRSLKMSAAGSDSIYWGASTPTGVMMFHQGDGGKRNVDFPPGFKVEAKLAEALVISVPAPAPQSPVTEPAQ